MHFKQPPNRLLNLLFIFLITIHSTIISAKNSDNTDDKPASSNSSPKTNSNEGVFARYSPNSLIYLPFNRSLLYNRRIERKEITLTNYRRLETLPSYLSNWEFLKTNPSDKMKSSAIIPLFDFGVRTSYFKYDGYVSDNRYSSYSYDYEVESFNFNLNAYAGFKIFTPVGILQLKVGAGPVLGYFHDTFIDRGFLMAGALTYAMDYFYYFLSDSFFSVNIGSNGIYGKTMTSQAMELGGWSYITAGFGWYLNNEHESH